MKKKHMRGVLAAAFCIAAGVGVDLWTIALFAGIVVVIVCGAVVWKKPSNAVALGALACAAGVIAAIALRVAMWLVGTPFMDFFLMALE